MINKHAKKDKNFVVARKELERSLTKKTVFEYVDHFGLYAGEQTLGNKIFVYEMLKKTLGVPGHIVEFGCWNGSNLMYLAKVMNLLQPHNYKKVFGFDNFKGLPAPNQIDGDIAKKMEGKYEGDLEQLKKLISFFEYNEYVKLVIGDATETIQTFAKENKDFLVSFAYIDFDLYEPCVAALQFLESTLVTGGIILFDEALIPDWPGESLALKEFLARNGRDYKLLSNNMSRQPTVGLKKVR